MNVDFTFYTIKIRIIILYTIIVLVYLYLTDNRIVYVSTYSALISKCITNELPIQADQGRS